jgi:hypothetical protein
MELTHVDCLVVFLCRRKYFSFPVADRERTVRSTVVRVARTSEVVLHCFEFGIAPQPGHLALSTLSIRLRTRLLSCGRGTVECQWNEYELQDAT